MIPIEKNKEYEIEITAVSSDGNGVGHIEGFAIFVPNTVMGDKIKTLAVKVNKSFAYGKLLEIVSPSEFRTVPKCPHSEKCGGCSLMHIDYDKQLDIKGTSINDALTRIGKIDGFEFEGVLGMDYPYEYRNKLVFPFGKTSDGGNEYGFYAERSHRIIPMERCMLGDELHRKVLRTIWEHMKKYNISAYDEENHSGVVRRAFIRKGFNTGEVMVIISANAETLKNQDELAKNIAALCPDIVSVILNINTKKTNLVLGDKNITLLGKDRISDVLCGFKYEISPHSFFQINPLQTEKLYAKAMEYANISSSDYVMDVYCGIGTISLLCTRYTKNVLGIEIVPQAIEDAKENAAKNNVSGCEFICGAAEDIVPKLIEKGKRPDVVIIDPPRKGSDEKTIGAIAKASPKRVVYVSCNPSTLARDLRLFEELGYKTEKVCGVDMFPHTAHVETVVLLNKV